MERPPWAPSFSAGALAILVVAVVAGCAAQPGREPATRPAERPEPAALKRRYNARLELIERLWARADVEVAWRKRNGGVRRESGEGHLLIDRPDSLALSMGKLGHTAFYLGTDGKRQWLFDLHHEPETLYLAAGEAARRSGPFGVPPRALLWVLGLRRIEAARSAWRDGLCEFVVGDPAVRLGLHPGTALPRRVILPRRGSGAPRVTARLSRPRRIELTGHADRQANGKGPLVPTRIVIRTGARESRLELNLTAMTNDPKRFRGPAFDLDALREAYAPARVLPWRRR